MYFRLFFAAQVGLVWAQNGTSRLIVQIPQTLYQEGGYRHQTALFGIPPYQGSLTTNVYYAKSDLCDPNVDTSIGVPLRPTDQDGKMHPWPAPFILMVDRGGCTFVKQVRNAQHAGAAAVIIADNICLCDEPCDNVFGDEACETEAPMMVDDGSGSDISIPSFLMFKADADSVKQTLYHDQPVMIEMRWSLPSPYHQVDYDVWSVPSHPATLDFFQNFATVAGSLGSHARFTPHMYLYDGIRSNCLGNDEYEYSGCYNLCTNNGRYCATVPDSNLEYGVYGADIVRESLRRLCIWKYYGEKDGIGKNWWDYVSNFTDLCNSADYFGNEDCVKDVYKMASIDGTVVTRCMNDSGGLTPADLSNVLLDKEIYQQYERGIVVLPHAVIDGVALRGPLTVQNVFEAICAKFSAANAPTICKQCGACSHPYECIKSGGTCPVLPVDAAIE